MRDKRMSVCVCVYVCLYVVCVYTTVCLTVFVEEINFLWSGAKRGQHAKKQGCMDLCVCECV